MSKTSSGSTIDWVSWLARRPPTAVLGLPPGYHVIGDAAYPISEQLLMLYPGRNLLPGEIPFNFHLGQLRVKIGRSFGILVPTWGILWRPFKVSLAGRPGLVSSLFHLHIFLQDEKVCAIRAEEEGATSGKGRPALPGERTLAPYWRGATHPVRGVAKLPRGRFS